MRKISLYHEVLFNPGPKAGRNGKSQSVAKVTESMLGFGRGMLEPTASKPQEAGIDMEGKGAWTTRIQ